MEYRVLGKLEALRDGVPIDLGAFKQRSLLALLLMNANSIVSTDRIIEELWGDEDGTADRQNTLWVYISNLRKVLDPEREKRSEGAVLLTRSPGYVLQADPEQVDASRFVKMVEEGRSLAATDSAAGSLLLSEALSMWSGHAYEDFTYELFARDEIARLEEIRVEAVTARIEADLQRGLSRELVSELESLVRQFPLREQLTGQLMLALYRSGRQAEALRAFQLLATRLGEELGIEPSGSVRKLEERIVMADPSLDAASAGAGPEPGLAIRGYELREQIGEGAYGVAYRAYQPAVGREVAIKAIRPELANSPAFIRRFEAEAQLVARLEHPHIVPLYDYWREPDAAYLVMRLMRGGNLQDLIETSALTDEEAARVAAHIGSALEAAHQNGVIHRDIKPANILIDDDGNAYLSDFGIALAEDHEDVDPYMRAATLAAPYASPEQAGRKKVSAASDVYSLGVVLAQALAGMTGDVEQISGALPPEVRSVIERATNRDRNRRYGDVATFIAGFIDAVSDGRAPGEVAAPVEARNPYKGLRAFEQADARDFFGREAIVDRLLARLGKLGAASRFVAVVGPSGSGKSSIVRAGLMPALADGALPLSEEWFQVQMTPGDSPFEELEDALLNIAVDPPGSLLEQLTAGEGGLRRAARRVLPAEGSQLVVLIDQFEELFTHADGDVADRFMEAIESAVTDERSRIRVIVTLRADFYDRPLRHRSFGELLRQGTEVITPMSPEELERAICGPAELVGVQCSPELVATLIGDVADRPGALSLLQYAMTEIFDSRDSAELSLAAYHELGGVSGALAERAERLLDDLSASGREGARQVLLALVTLGEGARDTRRRALVAEMEQLPVKPDDLRAVLDSFGRHRLFSFDRDPVSRGPTVEISHEALLTEWSRLADWVDDARVDVRYQRALRQAAMEWSGAGRSSEFLLAEGRFGRYQEWRQTSIVALGRLEVEYLDASQGIIEERRAEAEERTRRELELERSARRRLAGVAVVLAIGVIAAGLLTVFALRQSDEAGRQRDEASRQRDVAAAEREVALEREQEADRQRDAVEAALALRVAEQLPRRVMELSHEGETELALLLAGEGLVAAHEAGAPLDGAVGALHIALQDSGARFPAEAPDTALVNAPSGRRAVYLLELETLLGLRDAHTTRALTPAECRDFLAHECVPEAVRDRLPPDLMASAVLEARRELPKLLGTNVQLRMLPLVGRLSDRLEDEAGRLAWGLEARLVERAFGSKVSVELLIGGDDIALLPPDVETRSWIADDGRVAIPLNELVDPAVAAASAPQHMRDLLTTDGAPRGLWAWYDVYSGVWHRRDVFNELGLAEPTTWAELVDATERIAAAGEVPWCLGMRGDGAVVPVMAMVQMQVVDIGGLDLYDDWITHSIPADDPRILAAHRRVGQVLFDERFNGGNVAAETRSSALSRLLEPDGGCVMWPAPASWVQRPLRSMAESADIGVFPTPSADPASLVYGVYTSLVVDRPEARSLISGLASSEFGREAAEAAATTDIAANLGLPVSSYSDPISRTLAEAVSEAGANDSIRVEMFQRRPELESIFLEAVRRWFAEGDEALEGILADVEAQWQELET